MLHEWIQEKAEAWRRQLHREDKANNDQLIRLCCGACKGWVRATSDEEDPGPLAVGKRLSSGALAQVQEHPEEHKFYTSSIQALIASPGG